VAKMLKTMVAIAASTISTPIERGRVQAGLAWDRSSGWAFGLTVRAVFVTIVLFS
jgi:hypothetical protein